MNDYYSNDQKIITKKVFSECKKLLVYDLETTGFSSKDDRVIEFSGIKYNIVNSCLVEESRITVYIKPENPISDKITEVTGYTNAFFNDKGNEENAFKAIMSYMQDVDAVCGYNNVSFDDEFMKNLYSRYGNKFDIMYSLDTLMLSRQLIPKSEVENYKLCTIATHLGVAGDIDFHKAHDDVLATARILNVLLNEALSTEIKPKSTVMPTIYSINFWEGFRGYSRIYVTTSKGSVFYDIRGKRWSGKDVDINELDMDGIIQYCINAVGVDNETEFAKFKGALKCSG